MSYEPQYFCNDDFISGRITLKSRNLMNFENKGLLHKYHFYSAFNRTSQIFEWKGLPDEIPQRILELQIQMHGYTVIIKNNGKLYAMYGGLGGKFDYNYMPTNAIIANPYLKLSNQLYKINEDCVVIPNDTFYLGLTPLHNYYATQLVENDLSINCSLINLRLTDLLIAATDDEKQSLDDVIKDRKDGKLSSALDKDLFKEGIRNESLGQHNSNNLIQLIEHRQYVKGSWWNEIGVQSNYNMKRETITSNENILNVDSLLPLCDDMLAQRKLNCEKVNKMFGTKWSVDFSSAWKKLRNDIEVKEKIDEQQGLINSNKIEENKSNQLDKEKGGEKDDNKE